MPIETNYILTVGNKLHFEEKIIVQVGTIVNFWAHVLPDYQYFDIAERIDFQVYFPFETPKGFPNKIRSSRISGFDPRYYFRIGQGVARETGEYKFGIRATDGPRELFDEDPFLIII
ncbi:hypothetical protein [Pedobacter chitinilyticus]|uniref:Uncharacterized protein n=1 Tax=Pedobacter chitinilyticus TaxID=2233776 RepID=A0A443YW09_9SPHI|nr:hypothetical protein [Pedobacter chitinilyticus]RWU08118.1 hypothetical protein DPV69_06985 [Pedobacter chitinilyticus]